MIITYRIRIRAQIHVEKNKAVYRLKSTGIVRRVDDLGRIVLPMELRKILDIEPRDSLEIFMDGDAIVLKKYEPQCIFCGQAGNTETFKMKNVCKDCMKEMSESK